jgi:hypothetical protein
MLLLDGLGTSRVQVADSPKVAEVLTQWGTVVDKCHDRQVGQHGTGSG